VTARAPDLGPGAPGSESLFTPRFFLMCGFSFTVFLSAFMLLPTAPYRIKDLGGSTFSAGLFLGFLTYASALSAPFTGALADRVGKRRMLIVCSLVIAGFSAAYAWSHSYHALLVLVLVHGLFWSGLLSSSAAYLTDLLPATRRAEGIGYWGLSTVAAIAVAPAVGFWLYDHGWEAVCAAAAVLNLLMTAIAFSLEETPVRAWHGGRTLIIGELVEWRVLLASGTLFLYSFGYGGLTSFVALYADANGVTPRALYFPVLSAVIACTRPFSGALADRIGHRKVLLPSLGLIVVGLALLAYRGTGPWLVASAIVFGSGFGSAYPVFAAHVLHHVDASRRGAAFGSILAAFDIGIGTGSIATGWLVHVTSFRAAFAVAAGLATLSAPYFLLTERRLKRPTAAVP
jgi:MFS family permease